MKVAQRFGNFSTQALIRWGLSLYDICDCQVGTHGYYYEEGKTGSERQANALIAASAIEKELESRRVYINRAYSGDYNLTQTSFYRLKTKGRYDELEDTQDIDYALRWMAEDPENRSISVESTEGPLEKLKRRRRINECKVQHGRLSVNFCEKCGWTPDWEKRC